MKPKHVMWTTLSAAALALSSPVLAQSPGIDAFRAPTPVPSASMNESARPAHDIYARDRLSRARAEMAQGNFRQARRLLTRQSLPSAEGAYLLGVAHANLGDYSSAGGSFATSLEIDPQNVPARVGLALINIRAGRLELAVEALGEIEQRRAECQHYCRDTEALDRGAETIRQVLDASRF